MLYDLRVNDVLRRNSDKQLYKIIAIGKTNKITTDKVLNFQDVTLRNLKTKQTITLGYGNVQILFERPIKLKRMPKGLTAYQREMWKEQN